MALPEYMLCAMVVTAATAATLTESAPVSDLDGAPVAGLIQWGDRLRRQFVEGTFEEDAGDEHLSDAPAAMLQYDEGVNPPPAGAHMAEKDGTDHPGSAHATPISHDAGHNLSHDAGHNHNVENTNRNPLSHVQHGVQGAVKTKTVAEARENATQSTHGNQVGQLRPHSNEGVKADNTAIHQTDHAKSKSAHRNPLGHGHTELAREVQIGQNGRIPSTQQVLLAQRWKQDSDAINMLLEAARGNGTHMNSQNLTLLQEGSDKSSQGSSLAEMPEEMVGLDEELTFPEQGEQGVAMLQYAERIVHKDRFLGDEL